jgi:hypothetical protein
MPKKINAQKLAALLSPALFHSSSGVLRRDGTIFFIGANLPVYSTLETMYESYCQEATELFHVTFGDAEAFAQNLDMVHQIKRNFSTRLMGQVPYPLTDNQVEQAYLAGLDIMDLPFQVNCEIGYLHKRFAAATGTFTRWSITSTISAHTVAAYEARKAIPDLLALGVVPLLDVSGTDNNWTPAEAEKLFSCLATEWHRNKVPLKPIMPLLRLTSPFDFTSSTGFLRGVYDKLQDRRTLATSDLRRHLRTSGAIGSFESAGL